MNYEINRLERAVRKLKDRIERLEFMNRIDREQMLETRLMNERNTNTLQEH